MQQKEKHSPAFRAPDEHYSTHDWRYRLSARGCEQAQLAGTFFDGELDAHFDVGYVSPFLRTREIASLLGGPDFRWRVDDRLRERDWGFYGAVPAMRRARSAP